jgi:hypothetical protein
LTRTENAEKRKKKGKRDGRKNTGRQRKIDEKK